ncbi:hypothetical protein ACFWUQ_22840 [Streptomyces sp. NPDC058662]|uniref:hypothetical protein n=1 Tax=Streptomyces sp. NPDC058662 TaxID=3346583 RepID=UPI0036693D74
MAPETARAAARAARVRADSEGAGAGDEDQALGGGVLEHVVETGAAAAVRTDDGDPAVLVLVRHRGGIGGALDQGVEIGLAPVVGVICRGAQ